MSDTPRTDELAQKWDSGRLMPSDLLAATRELERENAALREWVKEEGKRNDVCTYGLLKEVCENCRCGKRKEAQS